MPEKKTSYYPLFVISIIILLDMAGYGVIVPLIPDFVKSMDLSPIEVSSLYVLYGVVLLVLPVPFGILADRVDRKTFLYVGMLGKAFALFGFTIVETYWGLLAARTVDAVAGTATWTVGLAMVADYYPQEKMGANFGIAMAASEVGALIGPLMSGPVADRFESIAPPFYIMSLLCTLSAALVFFMPRPDEVKSSKSPLQEIKSLLKKRGVLVVGALFLAGASFIAMIEPLYPVYLKKELSFSRTGISLMFGVVTGTITILMPVFGAVADRYKPRTLIIAGLAISAVTAPGLVLIRDTKLLVACIMLQGVGWSMLLAPAFPMFTEAVRKAGSQFGIAFGLSNSFWAAGFIIGPAMGGTLAQLWSIQIPFLVFSAVMIVLIAVFAKYS